MALRATRACWVRGVSRKFTSSSPQISFGCTFERYHNRCFSSDSLPDPPADPQFDLAAAMKEYDLLDLEEVDLDHGKLVFETRLSEEPGPKYSSMPVQFIPPPSGRNNLRVYSHDQDLMELQIGDDCHDLRLQSLVKVGTPQCLVLPYLFDVMACLPLMPTPYPFNILVLGLGGGSIPLYLRYIYPHTNIHVVELEQAVVTVARDYFGLPADDGRLKVHQTDAADWLLETADQVNNGANFPLFDLIIQDATPIYPSPLYTDEVLQAMRRLLVPCGLLVQNTHWRADHFSAPAVKLTSQVFRHNYCMRTDSNVIVSSTTGESGVALPADYSLDSEESRELARAGPILHPLDLDGFQDRALTFLDEGVLKLDVFANTEKIEHVPYD